jgi:hypothetical protein
MDTLVLQWLEVKVTKDQAEMAPHKSLTALQASPTPHLS